MFSKGVSKKQIDRMFNGPKVLTKEQQRCMRCLQEKPCPKHDPKVEEKEEVKAPEPPKQEPKKQGLFDISNAIMIAKKEKEEAERAA